MSPTDVASQKEDDITHVSPLSDKMRGIFKSKSGGTISEQKCTKLGSRSGEGSPEQRLSKMSQQTNNIKEGQKYQLQEHSAELTSIADQVNVNTMVLPC